MVNARQRSNRPRDMTVQPFTLVTRLERALERLRPQLSVRGCRASLAGIEHRTATVRLESGGADMSTVREMIDTSLMEAAPELAEVKIEATTGVWIGNGPQLVQITRKQEPVWPEPDPVGP
jgi:Fe-S cluster biogenesis protein NfuA